MGWRYILISGMTLMRFSTCKCWRKWGQHYRKSLRQVSSLWSCANFIDSFVLYNYICEWLLISDTIAVTTLVLVVRQTAEWHVCLAFSYWIREGKQWKTTEYDAEWEPIFIVKLVNKKLTILFWVSFCFWLKMSGGTGGFVTSFLLFTFWLLFIVLFFCFRFVVKFFRFLGKH